MNGSNMFRAVGRIHREPLNRPARLLSKRRICVTQTIGAKNLVRVEPETQRAAGATKPTMTRMKEKIVEFSFWMLKQGYLESTIVMRTRQMKILMKRGANLFDPESIKETIAKQPWKESRKALVTNTYTTFLSMMGLTWTPPRYQPIRKLPFIPTELEIDQLIAGCGKKTAAFLQTLKETAMRAGEAQNLEWCDVDMERRVIRVTPEKNSDPRVFKVSSKLIRMLDALPRKSKRVFGEGGVRSRRATFCDTRKRVAEKLQNPRILQIHFHTLRHWKATMLYHQTKDILYVMRFLGHKSVKNTMLYIQLAEALFKDTADEFITRVAKTVRATRALIEAGFEYVTDMDDFRIFRKRK